MPSADRITGSFVGIDLVNGSTVYNPQAFVTVLSDDGSESVKRPALLDTGADSTMMSKSAARFLLGMKDADLEQFRVDDVVGADGKPMAAYEIIRDLRLWSSQEPDADYITIPNVAISVLPSLLRNYSFLIGQLNGFQGRVFRHENRSTRRFWQIISV